MDIGSIQDFFWPKNLVANMCISKNTLKYMCKVWHHLNIPLTRELYDCSLFDGH